MPWSKGKPRSEETKKKMRANHKGMEGKKHSEEAKIRMRKAQTGEKNHNWGKHLSEETKRKLRKFRSGKTYEELFGREKARIMCKQMSEARKGNKRSNWKGGRRKDKNGYILILKPSHPHAHSDGYIHEHRLVMEEILGRYLKPEEVPHHKNEIQGDNRPDNLKLFPSNSKHLSFHKKEIQNEN